MQIKINDSGFSQALAQQQSSLDALRQCHEELKGSFDALSQAWIGNGGNSFRELSKELSDEMLAGIFMVTVLNKQTRTSQEGFVDTDTDLSQSLIDKKGK